jgi:hypothetical protein
MAVASLVSLATVALAADSSTAPEATRWLALIDAGHYAQSWSAAGALFRSHVTAAAWEAKAKPVRAPLGAVVSRSLASEEQKSQLPGVPDGDYKIVKFNTRFANKQTAVEAVILAHEPSGWKVDGYFIR